MDTIHILSESSAHSFYLPHQIVASLALAIVSMSVGLLLAWIIWGHCKGRVIRMNAKNQELRSQLKD